MHVGVAGGAAYGPAVKPEGLSAAGIAAWQEAALGRGCLRGWRRRAAVRGPRLASLLVMAVWQELKMGMRAYGQGQLAGLPAGSGCIMIQSYERSIEG